VRIHTYAYIRIHIYPYIYTYVYYHKTVVAVNALSARVTEGVPINNTLSLPIHSLSLYLYNTQHSFDRKRTHSIVREHILW
jgi:hypothetical protein